MGQGIVVADHEPHQRNAGFLDSPSQLTVSMFREFVLLEQAERTGANLERREGRLVVHQGLRQLDLMTLRCRPAQALLSAGKVQHTRSKNLVTVTCFLTTNLLLLRPRPPVENGRPPLSLPALDRDPDSVPFAEATSLPNVELGHHGAQLFGRAEAPPPIL
jgi:hypothetical protein